MSSPLRDHGKIVAVGVFDVHNAFWWNETYRDQAWSQGPYTYPIIDVQMLDEAVGAKGQFGCWSYSSHPDLHESVYKAVMEQESVVRAMNKWKSMYTDKQVDL